MCFYISHTKTGHKVKRQRETPLRAADKPQTGSSMDELNKVGSRFLIMLSFLALGLGHSGVS